MPQWTPEEARLNCAKGHQARRERLKRMAEREKLLDKLIHEANEKAAIPAVDPSRPIEDPLLRMRLNNVNDRIKECDARLQTALQDKEINGGLVKNLAMALGVLDGIEQRLSGRPSPGSFKPVQPKVKVAMFTPPADS